MFTNSRKQKILRSLDDPNHEYFAFFVCRNPIERLKSLYSYSLDLGRFKGGLKPKNLKDFILKVFKKNPTFGKNKSILNKIFILFKCHLAYNSMFSLCSPCTRHYNAVIKMETFSEDSRFSIFWQIIFEGKCVQVYFATARTRQTSARESQQQSRKSDGQEGGGAEAVQGHPSRGHRELGPEVEAGL